MFNSEWEEKGYHEKKSLESQNRRILEAQIERCGLRGKIYLGDGVSFIASDVLGIKDLPRKLEVAFPFAAAYAMGHTPKGSIPVLDEVVLALAVQIPSAYMPDGTLVRKSYKEQYEEALGTLRKPDQRGRIRLDVVGPESPALRAEAFVEIPEDAIWMKADEREVGFKEGFDYPGQGYRIIDSLARVARIPLKVVYASDRVRIKEAGPPQFYSSLVQAFAR